MKYRIVDNFLNPQDFSKIKNILESPHFPWYYQKEINKHDSKDSLDCYFTHSLFDTMEGSNNFFNTLSPILQKIKIKSLIRIKCNLYPKTEKLTIHKKHKDFDYKHKGALFYINTNNGGTILNDNTKIDSVENRMLFFEPNILHSSTSTTNQKARININFNYF